MAKSGQARVPTEDQQRHLFEVIQQHRHAEKNTAIMQISFKLGLRAQEIALLQIKEVATLTGAPGSRNRAFKLLEILCLPAAYTKGADAMHRSKSTYTRKQISFDIHTFIQIVRQIEVLAKSGVTVDPTQFYPPLKKHRGKSRDLPMVDSRLRSALESHLNIRLLKDPYLKPNDPLFI
jgi:hypothetical protein